MFSDYPVVTDFVGRSVELRQLHELLFDRGYSVLVVGSAGSGKTTLAYLYVHQYKNSYSSAFIIRVATLSSPTDLYPLLAHELGLSTTDRLEVTQFLADQHALVILDGLDEIHPSASDAFYAELGHLLRTKGKSRLLMTARTTHSAPQFAGEDYYVLQLGGLTLNEFKELLHLRGIQISDQVLAQLHDRIEGHPFALRLLLSLLEKEGFDELTILEKLVKAYAAQWGSVLSNILVVGTEEGLKAVPVSRYSSFGILTPNAQLFVGAPYVQVRTHAHFWREQLERFDELLNDPLARERHFQEFFEQNPQFLLGLDYERAIPHPVLFRETEGPLIPDFFLQPLDSVFCDILDLKLPRPKIVVGSKNRLRLSSPIYEAIAQLREYHDYFDDPKYREAVRTRYDVTAYKPALSVVIGRAPRHVSPEKYRQIMTGIAGIRLITYDDLRKKMERMIETMSF